MKKHEPLISHLRETAMLESISALLSWDEQTYMPSAAGSYRADQITMLSTLLHQRRTDARIPDWLGELESDTDAGDPNSDWGAIARQTRRDYERQTKLPLRLVQELARTSVQGQQAWVEARPADDFARLQPFLESLVGLKREEADALGYEGEAYDALLDEYEPNMRTAAVRQTLEGLREELVPLVQQIQDSGRTAPVKLLHAHYPTKAQAQLGRQTAAKLGFDFDRGRLDVTAHPFCTEMGPDDCRITTRYDESFFPSAFFGTLHEAGHGMYEQGMRPDQYGLPTGRYVSLGIHESQSRFWENQVGRSRAFWDHFFPQAQAAFPDALQQVSPDDFFFAINHVEPSLIRVEADEATYNLHIIIRFELEQDLIENRLAVADLPDAWNAKYEQYLGLTPPSNADGVMQDIHWPSGAIGYFSTYSLGNLYAAQFYEQADQDLGGLDGLMRKGEFAPLLNWLQTNLHQHGQCYSPAELVERTTGKPLSHEPLIRHLRNKLEPLYLD